MGFGLAKRQKTAPQGPQRAPYRVSQGPKRAISVFFVTESALDPVGMDPKGVWHHFWSFWAVFGLLGPVLVPRDQLGPV